ncbi:hypothetical protein [Bacteroides congonensis]|uniref:hypothetical protein n=1 Tax=Bacteroides congonensis TaxID=1871006 RepID=UPI0026753D8B|nr:hypothetical protein [Bacteroides congonensis]
MGLKIRQAPLQWEKYLFCQKIIRQKTRLLFIVYCKAAGVDFRTWMIYFLGYVHDYDEDYTKNIANLLPDKLKAAGPL